jgi:hypothetical protein
MRTRNDCDLESAFGGKAAAAVVKRRGPAGSDLAHARRCSCLFVGGFAGRATPAAESRVGSRGEGGGPLLLRTSRRGALLRSGMGAR